MSTALGEQFEGTGTQSDDSLSQHFSVLCNILTSDCHFRYSFMTLGSLLHTRVNSELNSRRRCHPPGRFIRILLAVLLMSPVACKPVLKGGAKTKVKRISATHLWSSSMQKRTASGRE